MRGSRWWGLAGVAFIGSARLASGQDAHYWTTAYGTSAQLLGGVTIGSSDGLSATYYDPGSFALLPRTTFAIAGSAFQFSSVKYDNGLGPRRDLATSSVVGIPSLLAGEIPIKGFGGHDRLAYSVLSRQSLDLDIEGRNLPLDSAINAPNYSYTSGTVRLDEHLSEYWAGVTYSHPLNEHIGIGISPYVAIRNQTDRLEGNAVGVGTNGDAATALRDYDFSYSNWRLLAKLGVGFVYPRIRAGLVLTTPGLKILGSGDVGRTDITVNQGVGGTGLPPPTVAVDYQENLSSSYHSPLAIGAGGSYALGPDNELTTVHASVEWYNSVGHYSLLSPLPFTPATGGAALSGTVQQQLQSVVNVGVGLEHAFGPKFTGYASFRTDQSALGPAQDNNSLVARWDLRHVTGGVQWTIGRSDIVLGGDFAFGATTQSSDIGMTSSGAPLVPAGARVGYEAFTLIFGFRLAGP